MFRRKKYVILFTDEFTGHKLPHLFGITQNKKEAITWVQHLEKNPKYNVYAIAQQKGLVPLPLSREDLT